MNKKWLIILISVLVLITLYWTRYQTIEVRDTCYKINRLTGETTWIRGGESYQVIERER